MPLLAPSRHRKLHETGINRIDANQVVACLRVLGWACHDEPSAYPRACSGRIRVDAGLARGLARAHAAARGGRCRICGAVHRNGYQAGACAQGWRWSGTVGRYPGLRPFALCRFAACFFGGSADGSRLAELSACGHTRFRSCFRLRLCAGAAVWTRPYVRFFRSRPP